MTETLTVTQTVTAATSSTTPTPSIPSILTANTYFWTPGRNASGRRAAEKRNCEIVRAFFLSIGFTEVADGVYEKDGIRAEFDYSESCHNVYKHLSVTRNGKRSNITAIRKMLAQ